jgi:hypothetical protein
MKKLLIAAITTIWIVTYSTFCFALEWYNFKTAQFETIDDNYTQTSDWCVAKLGGTHARAACWHLNYTSGSSQHIFLLRKISDFSAYIPQDAASQGLYQIYIEMGDTPLESAIKVLKIIVQEEN